MGWQDAPLSSTPDNPNGRLGRPGDPPAQASDTTPAGAPKWKSAPLAKSDAGPKWKHAPLKTDDQPGRGSYEENLKDEGVDPGVGEAIASVAGSTVGYVAGIENAFFRGGGKSREENLRLFKQGQEATQVEPKTETGKALVKAASIPAIPLNYVADRVKQGIKKVGGDELTQEVVGGAVPYVAPAVAGKVATGAAKTAIKAINENKTLKLSEKAKAEHSEYIMDLHNSAKEHDIQLTPAQLQASALRSSGDHVGAEKVLQDEKDQFNRTNKQTDYDHLHVENIQKLQGSLIEKLLAVDTNGKKIMPLGDRRIITQLIEKGFKKDAHGDVVRLDHKKIVDVITNAQKGTPGKVKPLSDNIIKIHELITALDKGKNGSGKLGGLTKIGSTIDHAIGIVIGGTLGHTGGGVLALGAIHSAHSKGITFADSLLGTVKKNFDKVANPNKFLAKHEKQASAATTVKSLEKERQNVLNKIVRSVGPVKGTERAQPALKDRLPQQRGGPDEKARVANLATQRAINELKTTNPPAYKEIQEAIASGQVSLDHVTEALQKQATAVVQYINKVADDHIANIRLELELKGLGNTSQKRLIQFEKNAREMGNRGRVYTPADVEEYASSQQINVKEAQTELANKGIIPIDHVFENGVHIVRTPNGITHFHDDGKTISAEVSVTEPASQRQGEGFARTRYIVDLAIKDGKTYVSDGNVSDKAVGIYRKLKAEGYPVIENPSIKNPKGDGWIGLHKNIQGVRTPVFEVRPKPKKPE